MKMFSIFMRAPSSKKAIQHPFGEMKGAEPDPVSESLNLGLKV